MTAADLAEFWPVETGQENGPVAPRLVRLTVNRDGTLECVVVGDFNLKHWIPCGRRMRTRSSHG
jgi:hypothetical protein